MDVYDFLRKSANGGKISMSLKTISNRFDMTRSQVRGEIKKLVQNGYMTVVRKKKDGVDQSNEYLLTGKRPDIEFNVGTAEAKSLFCKYASERANRKFNPAFSFPSYTKAFDRIASICKEEEMNLHLYIVACFHTFTTSWCRKTFSSPYPPPYVLSNRKNAPERYAGFLRYINQHSEEDPLVRDFNEEIRNSYYVWKRIDIGNDVNALAMLVNNGTIMAEFFLGLSFIEDKHMKLLHKSILVKIDEKNVRRAKSIIEGM